MLQSRLRWSVSSVLHPTDLTQVSDSAFAHALVIALLSQARLRILHVQDKAPDATGRRRFPGVRDTLVRWGVLEAGSPRSAVAEKLHIEVDKIKVKSGSPVAAIEDSVDRYPTDLIVLATERRAGLARWIRPSVAEAASRKTRRMTLFVPHTARGFISSRDGSINLKRVLVPVRSSPRPDGAIEHAARAAALFGDDDNVEITVLHVGERMPPVSIPARRKFEWNQVLRSGDLVDQIVSAADTTRADLIVMGMKARGDRSPVLKGTTTEQVLRRGPCALLAIPAG